MGILASKIEAAGCQKHIGGGGPTSDDESFSVTDTQKKVLCFWLTQEIFVHKNQIEDGLVP